MVVGENGMRARCELCNSRRSFFDVYATTSRTTDPLSCVEGVTFGELLRPTDEKPWQDEAYRSQETDSKPRRWSRLQHGVECGCSAQMLARPFAGPPSLAILLLAYTCLATDDTISQNSYWLETLRNEFDGAIPGQPVSHSPTQVL